MHYLLHLITLNIFRPRYDQPLHRKYNDLRLFATLLEQQYEIDAIQLSIADYEAEGGHRADELRGMVEERIKQIAI